VVPVVVVPVAPGQYVIEVSNGAVHTETKFNQAPAAKQ